MAFEATQVERFTAGYALIQNLLNFPVVTLRLRLRGQGWWWIDGVSDIRLEEGDMKDRMNLQISWEFQAIC